MSSKLIFCQETIPIGFTRSAKSKLARRYLRANIFPMVANNISYEKVREEALHLPLEDRSRLASRLLESLDDDDDVSPEWLEEIRRRVKEMKDGTAIMIPHDEVMANVLAKLAKNREERAKKVS